WLNRDPIEERGGRNLYAFVVNDPVDRFDAFGLDWADRYAACLEQMDPLNVCGYLPAVVGPGAMIPTGTIGKICRRGAAAITGWCSGVSYGCMVTASLGAPPGPA